MLRISVPCGGLIQMRDAFSAKRRRTPGGPAATLKYLAAGPSLTRPVRAGHDAEGAAMKQLRITRRHRPDGWRLDPLPLDPRDPDIVRAKELARRSRAVPSRPGRARRDGN
jgi:hypothetical protein